MRGRRGGARERGARVRGTPRRAALALLVLLAVLATAPGDRAPGAAMLGPGVAAAQGPRTSSVPPPSADGQRRAAELRQVARDALRRRDAGDDGPDLDGSLLGIGGVVWRVLAVVLVVVAVIAAVALYRRGPRRRRAAAAAGVAAPDGIAVLEERARAAEGRGEHRTAVLLWFRAGALRLATLRSLRADGTSTASDVAHRSGDPRVAGLATLHDRAAYGPGPVGADDSRGTREGWAEVLRDPAPPTEEGTA